MGGSRGPGTLVACAHLVGVRARRRPSPRPPPCLAGERAQAQGRAMAPSGHTGHLPPVLFSFLSPQQYPGSVSLVPSDSNFKYQTSDSSSEAEVGSACPCPAGVIGRVRAACSGERPRAKGTEQPRRGAVGGCRPRAVRRRQEPAPGGPAPPHPALLPRSPPPTPASAVNAVTDSHHHSDHLKCLLETSAVPEEEIVKGDSFLTVYVQEFIKPAVANLRSEKLATADLNQQI